MTTDPTAPAWLDFPYSTKEAAPRSRWGRARGLDELAHRLSDTATASLTAGCPARWVLHSMLLELSDKLREISACLETIVELHGDDAVDRERGEAKTLRDTCRGLLFQTLVIGQCVRDVPTSAVWRDLSRTVADLARACRELVGESSRFLEEFLMKDGADAAELAGSFDQTAVASLRA